MVAKGGESHYISYLGADTQPIEIDEDIMSDYSSGGLMGWSKKAAIWLLKLVIAVGTLVLAFVGGDDWWSRQTRVQIITTNVEEDHSIVLKTLIEIETGDQDLVYNIEHHDNEKYFETILATHSLQAIMGGNVESIGMYTINSFDVALGMLRMKHIEDSLSLLFEPDQSSTANDSVKTTYQRRRDMMEELKRMRQRYYEIYADRVRLKIQTTILNSSSAPASIAAPALLQISFESGTEDIQLSIAGNQMSMSMFGVEMINVGRPQTSIEGHSQAVISFVTPTAKEVGSEAWQRVMKALRQSGATARISTYTIDDEIVESETFPFSADFAGNLTKKRIESLKQRTSRP